MLKSPKSIRPFIGCSDFNLSRSFYSDLGFKESRLSASMSYFCISDFGFYLQDYFVKDWIENSMVFFEVENLEGVYRDVLRLNLENKYPGTKIKPVVYNDWGNEFFIHDPDNILWHVGEFKDRR